MAHQTPTAEKAQEQVRRRSEWNVPEVEPGQVTNATARLGVGGNDLSTQVAAVQRLGGAQRVALMRNIGRVQGNQHAQHLVTACRQSQVGQGYGGLTVQARMSVSEPGDEYEQEADQVAERVMRMSEPALPPDEGDESSSTGIHRSWSTSTAGGVQVAPEVETRIERMRGGGRPLPTSEREFFEPRLGVDLSGVRVHTDGEAVQTARELSARAYTVGSDIAFNAGEYEPGTDRGRRLLAHELAHVVQQGGAGTLKRRPKVNRCMSPACRADEAALKGTVQRQAIGPVKFLASRKINRCATPACRADEAVLKSPLQRWAKEDTAGWTSGLASAVLDVGKAGDGNSAWASWQKVGSEWLGRLTPPAVTDQAIGFPAPTKHSAADPSARPDVPRSAEVGPTGAIEPDAQTRPGPVPRPDSLKPMEHELRQPDLGSVTEPTDENLMSGNQAAWKPALSEESTDKTEARLETTASLPIAPTTKESSSVKLHPLLPEGTSLPEVVKVEPILPTMDEGTDSEAHALTAGAVPSVEIPEPAKSATPAAEGSLMESLGQTWQASRIRVTAGLPDLKSLPLTEAWAAARQHAAEIERAAQSAAGSRQAELKAARPPWARIEWPNEPGERAASTAVEPLPSAGVASAGANAIALPSTPAIEKATTKAPREEAPAPGLETEKAQWPQPAPPVEDEPGARAGEKQPEVTPRRGMIETERPALAELPAGQSPRQVITAVPSPARVEAPSARPADLGQAEFWATVASPNKTTEENVLVQREPLVVQRDSLLDSLIPDWAQKLLDALTGDAETKKGELEGEGGSKSGELDSLSKAKGQEIEEDGKAKGSELERDGGTKSAELEADQQTKSAELEADQQTKSAELEADQQTKSAELESDQETKGAELEADQETKGAELEAEQAAKSAELEADQQTKSAELESDQETKSTELEAEQQAQGAELEADQESKGAELEADAEAKAQELQQNWGQTQQAVTQLHDQVTQQVDRQAATLQAEAEVAGAQVEAGWGQLQSEAEATIQNLDAQANELCVMCQGKADEYLSTFDPLIEGAQAGWQRVQEEAQAAWDGFIKSAQPTLDQLGQKWQEFTAWAGLNVWEPLRQKAGEFAVQVGRWASQAWSGAQQLWSNLTQSWANAEEWIQGRAEAARTWITGRAEAARTYIAGKAEAARAWITGRADAARTFIADKAESARTFIADRADAARTFITGKAEAARAFITGKAEAANAWIVERGEAARAWMTDKGNAARTWITGQATAAAGWIQGKVNAAQAWIQGKGQAITDWFRNKGQSLVSGMSNMARGAASFISSKGGKIGRWFGGLIGGLVSGVESVGHAAVDRVGRALGSGLGWVESKASAAVGLVGNVGTGAVNVVGNAATHATNWVQDKAIGAVNWVQDKATGAVNWVSHAATGAVSWVESKATGAVSWVESKATGAVSWVESKATGAVSWVESKATGAVSWVESKATGVVNGLEAAGRGAVSWVESKAVGAVQSVKSAWATIQSGWNSFTAWLGPQLQWVGQKASELAGQINTAIIQPATQWVQEQWGHLQSYIAEKFPGLVACWETFKAFAGAAWDKFQQIPVIGDVVNAVGEILEGALAGDFLEDPNGWNILGQVIVGFIPVVGQVADARDLIAALWKAAKDEAGWTNVALALAGFILGLGDVGKHADKLDEVTEMLQGVARGLDDLPTGPLDELTSLLSRSPEWMEAVGKNPDVLADLLKRGDEGLSMLSQLSENPAVLSALLAQGGNLTKLGDETAGLLAQYGDDAIRILEEGDSLETLRQYDALLKQHGAQGLTMQMLIDDPSLLRGQLTEDDLKFLSQLSEQLDEPLIVTGGRSETMLGRLNRKRAAQMFDELKAQGVPDEQIYQQIYDELGVPGWGIGSGTGKPSSTTLSEDRIFPMRPSYPSGKGMENLKENRLMSSSLTIGASSQLCLIGKWILVDWSFTEGSSRGAIN